MRRKIFILLLPLFFTAVYGGISRERFSHISGTGVQSCVMLLPESITATVVAPVSFAPEKPVYLALYALPNGNTTEQTIGRKIIPGDDWHFDIQHIGAQSQFIRERMDAFNFITVYFENSLKSWPAWKARHPDHAQRIRSAADSVMALFPDAAISLMLTGHSGGGRFIFSYLDGSADIPENVVRISFLDSNYGYEREYGDKIIRWLQGADERFLTVMAYNDSIALYKGKPIVSSTGGTWVRTKRMIRDLSQAFPLSRTQTEGIIRYRSADGKIRILMKTNPDRKILHTVQVERNGFIHSVLAGTPAENSGYTYYGNRAYIKHIQPARPEPD